MDWILAHLTGLATLALAAGTFRMVCLSAKNIGITKEIEKRKITPYCTVESSNGSSIAYNNAAEYKRIFLSCHDFTPATEEISGKLIVENNGQGPAFNVLLSFIDRNGHILGGRRRVKEILSPGQKTEAALRVVDYTDAAGVKFTVFDIINDATHVMLEYKMIDKTHAYSKKPISFIEFDPSALHLTKDDVATSPDCMETVFHDGKFDPKK
jgi:hypothetical protein